ncbi:MAG: thioredoxin domain-containing protein [Nocardioidaceae bacterium]
MSKKKSTATRRAESQAASARAAEIRAAQERKERRRNTLVVTGVGVAVLAIVLVLFTIANGKRDTTAAAGSAPTGAIGYAVPAGPSSAPVRVTVYEDFLCPFCGQFEQASSKALEDDLTAGKVQIRYHVLTFLDRSTSTEYSSRAANALAVVLDQAGPDVAKKFHDLLFAHQPAENSAGLTDGQLVGYAVEAGATKADVQGGIADRTFEQWVKNVGDQASKDKVNQTPTVFVDGKLLSGSMDSLVAQVEKAVAAG